MSCGSRKFVTVFTKASHWSLWRARRKQVTSHTTFCNFYIRLLSIVRSSMWPLLFSFYDSNPVLTFSSSDARYVTRLLTAVPIEGVQITSVPISGLRNPSDTSSLSVTIIIRSTSPNIFNGNSFVTRGQAPNSHPPATTCLYILLYVKKR